MRNFCCVHLPVPAQLYPRLEICVAHFHMALSWSGMTLCGWFKAFHNSYFLGHSLKTKGKKICACQQESKNTENKYVWDSMFVAIEACKTSFISVFIAPSTKKTIIFKQFYNLFALKCYSKVRVFKKKKKNQMQWHSKIKVFSQAYRSWKVDLQLFIWTHFPISYIFYTVFNHYSYPICALKLANT